MGRPWYEDGKLLRKKNSFTDFVACAGYLIGKGYTSHSRLAILGGSAGGLLIGAVLNLRPDLFHAAVAKVPFVNVLDTMLKTNMGAGHFGASGRYERFQETALRLRVPAEDAGDRGVTRAAHA